MDGSAVKLTPKQFLFVKEYLVDLNGTQAAIRAGYSARTAHAISEENLRKPYIAAAIQEAMDKRAERVDLTADRVLEEIKHAAFLDPIDLFSDDGRLLPLKEMPERARRAISGIEVEEIYDGTGKDRQLIGYLKKIKLVSKEGTLTLAGRNLNLWKEVGSKDNPLNAAVTVTMSREDADL